jgi:hypothetical protein
MRARSVLEKNRHRPTTTITATNVSETSFRMFVSLVSTLRKGKAAPILSQHNSTFGIIHSLTFSLALSDVLPGTIVMYCGAGSMFMARFPFSL